MPIQRRNRKTGRKEWYGRVLLPDGRRKERRKATKREALEWEVLIKQKLTESFSETATPAVSLHTLITKHLLALWAKGVAQGTYDDKALVFAELLSWPGVSPIMPVAELKHDTVREFLDHIAQTRSGHRANTFRKHIVRLWNWAKRARIVMGECPWDVEMYKYDKPDKYVPPEEDFWKVYDMADQVTQLWHGKPYTRSFPHRKRMLLAFLHTAARRNELFNLRWKDVDFKGMQVRLYTKKRTSGREGDWIPLTDVLASELKAQRLETGFEEYVFINPFSGLPYAYANDMVKSICVTAGVKPFSFHAIRHLSASLLDKAGVPLATIQRILRHKSVTTTARYVHSLKDASEAANRAFGGKVLEMKKASGE